jgi:hypothetical protein
MTSDGEREAEALQRLLRAAPAAGLSGADVDALREIIKAFEGLRALGRGVRFLVVTLGIVAAGIAAWETIAGKVRSWLTGS